MSYSSDQSGITPANELPVGYTAASEYTPHRFEQARDQGWGRWSEYFDGPESHWSPMPTVAGVERAAYKHEAVDSTTLDTVRGTAFFENIDPTAVAACIHQPGHRMIWETRIKQVAIIERFNQVEFLFYIILRGVGPIYWPRDAVGIQALRSFRPNGEMVTDRFISQANRVDMMWCSLDNPPIAPQEGKVRARIFAGYKVEARGNGCRMNFFVSLQLSTPIPAYLRRALVNEIPLSLARFRDAVPTFGIVPYIIDEQKCLILQHHYWDPDTRQSQVRAKAAKVGTFMIILDTTRMYASGITMPTIEGPGAHAVRIQEAMTGDRLFVHLQEASLMQPWLLTLEPRDKEPEPDTQTGWW
ncbi:unnamed protein product [Sympodiomycopsis kandeliae]